MMRVSSTAFAVLAAMFAWTPAPTFAVDHEHVERWQARLLVEMGLGDEQSPSFWSDSVLRIVTIHALAATGREQPMIERILAAPNPSNDHLLHVAAAQSTGDDLPGAMRTLALATEDSWRERIWRIIVLRQAQRGDVQDAVDLLTANPNSESSRKAWPLVIDAALEHEWSDEALWRLINGVSDKPLIETLRRQVRRYRDYRAVGDPLFLENSIIRTRHELSLLGFSQEHEDLLRERLSVEIAIHQRDEARFQTAISGFIEQIKRQAAGRSAAGWGMVADLFARHGDVGEAVNYYQKAARHLADADSVAVTSFLYAGPQFSRRNHYDGIIAYLPPESLSACIDRVGSLSTATGDQQTRSEMIISDFSESLGKVQSWDRADQLYSAANSPRQRLLVAAGVLSGFVNSTAAGRKRVD
ncbi:MAG: hypothetical protein U1A77_19045 [Pirellulales bacterium]